MRRAPDRQLRHIETQVAAGERLVHAVGDALPGQGDISPPAGGARPRPACRAARPATTATVEQRAGRERLAELEVGHVAADLDRADGAIDQQQMADEPGRRDQAAAQVEGEPEQMPVGEE